CENKSAVFTDNSTSTGKPINSWHWDFGVAALTNDTSNIKNPSYGYTAYGTYSATLTVGSINTAPDGSQYKCYGTPTTKTVKIDAKPIVNAGGPQTVCENNANAKVTLNGNVKYKDYLGNLTVGTGLWSTIGTGKYTSTNAATSSLLTDSYNPSNA